MGFAVYDISEKKMSYPDKKQVLKLIQNVNKSKKRTKKDMYPLEFKNEGWRFVFPKSMENYDFLPSGKKLLSLAKYSIDFEGGYYYIQFQERP